MDLNTVLQIAEGYAKLSAQELGLIKTTPKAEARYNKCLTCVIDGVPTLVNGNCRLCTCQMKAKVLVTKAYCPAGKW